jgi:dienelactone hydrolase
MKLERRTFLAACAAPLVSASLPAAEAAPPGYANEPFAHGGIELDVWRGGKPQDPLVFLLHDITGLGQHCFDFGNVLIEAGLSVAIPRFFGGFGGGGLGYFKACELHSLFRCFNANSSGRVMPWIAALAQEGSGTREFGAIGNCLTGILPLLMLRSPRCIAPVICQPAVPFKPNFTDKKSRPALALPQADLEFAAERTRRARIPVLGVRFAIDSRSRPERFCSIRRALGDAFVCLELEGEGHSTLLGKHHSPLARTTVIGFLKARLEGVPWDPPSSPCPSRPC